MALPRVHPVSHEAVDLRLSTQYLVTTKPRPVEARSVVEDVRELTRRRAHVVTIHAHRPRPASLVHTSEGQGVDLTRDRQRAEPRALWRREQYVTDVREVVFGGEVESWRVERLVRFLVTGRGLATRQPEHAPHTVRLRRSPRLEPRTWHAPMLRVQRARRVAVREHPALSLLRFDRDALTRTPAPPTHHVILDLERGLSTRGGRFRSVEDLCRGASLHPWGSAEGADYPHTSARAPVHGAVQKGD